MEEARAVELEERRMEGCSVTQCEGLQPECGKEGEAFLQSQEQHPAEIFSTVRRSSPNPLGSRGPGEFIKTPRAESKTLLPDL